METLVEDETRNFLIMKLLEELSKKSSALKVAEVAHMFGVTPQHIYKMAASGKLPSFRVAGAVRFDPHDLAQWLTKKAPHAVAAEASHGRVG